MKEALLVIDVQNEYFTGKLPVTHPAGSLDNILKAMDWAHDGRVPVVVIRHTNAAPEATTFREGTPGWELHDEIKRRHADVIIEKTLPGSFTGTNLENWLQDQRDRDGHHRRLHDPDVLRYHRAAGIPPELCGEFPFRCNRHARLSPTMPAPSALPISTLRSLLPSSSGSPAS